MSAQNRYATLQSDLIGKGAEPAPALPSRRRTPERLTGRAPVPSAAPEATAPAPVAPTAGDVFYDKGAATAANFRPSYWSYERKMADEAQQPAAAPAPVAPKAGRVVELAPSQRSRLEPASPAPNEDLGADAPAVVGMPLTPPATIASLQPAVADELTATIEHVLVSRYASGRPVQDTAPKPRLVATAVTADSLMAELAQARQSQSEQNKPKSSRRSSRAPKKARSLLDRAFAFGGLALILFALLVLSPWRDSLLSPSITHFFC